MSLSRVARLVAVPIVALALGCPAPPRDRTTGTEAMAKPTSLASATFAGGCFWCVEADMEKIPGVAEVVSGYTGGTVENPTYEEVSTGETGHFEAVRVLYDPTVVSYAALLDAFFDHIDPTDFDGQFADRGPQYRTAIFFHDEDQRRAAEAAKEALARSGRFAGPIATLILPAGAFYPAEDYHQDFYKKKPAHYGRYRAGSGRDRFLEKARSCGASCVRPAARPAAGPVARPRVAKRSEEALKGALSPLAFEVTRGGATEPPFDNAYWDEKRTGIYVDVATGEPLFSSADKFDSGTGWPSFVKPLEPGNLVTKVDRTAGMVRTEVRSKHGDSHLGHLFDDGPAPGGLRYCINSAALRFVPAEELEAEGYGEYLPLFR